MSTRLSFFNQLTVKAYILLLIATVLLAIVFYFLVTHSIQGNTYRRESAHVTNVLTQIRTEIESDLLWQSRLEQLELERKLGAQRTLAQASYVRRYDPWGWINGAAVYQRDVKGQSKLGMVSRLRDRLRDVSLHYNGDLFVFKGDRTMLIHPNKSLEGRSLADMKNPMNDGVLVDQMIDAVKRGKRVFHYNWDRPDDPGNKVYDKVTWLTYVKPLDWYIGASFYLDDINAPGNTLAGRSILIGSSAILLLVAIVMLLIRNGLRPLTELSYAAGRVSKGDYSQQVEISRNDEIGLLADAFNRMVKHIRDHMEIVHNNELVLKEGKMRAEADSKAKEQLLEQIQNSRVELEYRAKFDALTELPNRNYFNACLDQSISRAERTEGMLAVLYLDLDHFKNINDSLGHRTGDDLLKSVSQRLQARLRGNDVLARVGGDEFMILMDGINNPDNAASLATALVDCLSVPFHLQKGMEFYVDVSIGISIYPDDGKESGQLLMNADAAMFQAKEAGRARMRFYSHGMTDALSVQLHMETRLRTSLKQGGLRLAYQPVYDLQSNEMVGMEALARWHDKELGEVSPGNFIPLSEKTGLILRIGDWVFQECCRQMAEWMGQGIAPPSLAVNISARQLAQHSLPDRILSWLENYGLQPSQFMLELTESAVMSDAEANQSMLMRLKQLGFSLAVDDFGTGYSSLAYLKQLDVDKLKIDRSFVKDVPGDKEDNQLVSTIITLAWNLGLDTIAEGVETEEQATFLKDMGCNEVQGFLFSRPLEVHQYEQMMAERNSNSIPA